MWRVLCEAVCTLEEYQQRGVEQGIQLWVRQSVSQDGAALQSS